jgi:hypothetical protein
MNKAGTTVVKDYIAFCYRPWKINQFFVSCSANFWCYHLWYSMHNPLCKVTKGWGIRSDCWQKGLCGKLKFTWYVTICWLGELLCSVWLRFRCAQSSELASVARMFARCRHRYFFMSTRQRHPLDAECIKPILQSFCWHLWAKTCLNSLSDQLRSRFHMNSLTLKVQGQAQTLIFCDLQFWDTTQMYV